MKLNPILWASLAALGCLGCAGLLNGAASAQEAPLPPAAPTTIPRRSLSWPKPGAEFFVSPTGSDTAPGTQAQPFATLERARDAIRQRKQAGPLPAGGVAVWVRGGAYPIRGTLSLAAQDSGTETAPICYRAWGNERPVFTGAIRLERFDPVTDATARERIPAEARTHVVAMDVAALGVTNLGPLRLGGYASGRGFQTHPMRELYFNGQAQPLARGPNADELRIASVLEEDLTIHGLKGSKTGRFTYEGDRPTRWKDEAEVLLYGYWFWDWADSYECVAAIDPTRREITLAAPFHNYGYRAGQPFYAVNALSELDRPGEWCLDSARNRLYFWPPADPRTAIVELSAADCVFVELQDVTQVRFEGLAWQFGCRDGIRIGGGTGCLLARCAVRHFAGNGIEIRGGSDHMLLGCDVHSLGRGGVALSGGNRKTLSPGRHLVEDCHIHDLSRIDHTYTPAVLCEGVGHRIAHNRLHDVRSSAIRLEGNDHLVEFNDISRAVLESDDQGAVDMWGDATYRGNVYRYNYFHDIGSRWGDGHEAKLGQAGIRLDDAISGTLIYGNLFFRAGGGGLGFGAIQIHGGKDNRIENNLFVECPAAVSFSAWGDRRWREFVQNALASPQLDRNLYTSRYAELGRLAEDHDVNHLRHNLAIGCAEFLRREPGRTLQADNIVTTNTTAFPSAAQGLFPEAADPRTMAAFGLDPIPFPAIGPSGNPGARQAASATPYVVPVLVLHYFPTDGTHIDLKVTGDWGESLAATREKTRRQTRDVIAALEAGSRHRGYQLTNATPALRYTVVESLEFLRPLPTRAKPGHDTPMTDYAAIVEAAGIRGWVEDRGVKEVWIWGYHGGKVDLWESNMASRFGDVSNSDRDPDDLPVLKNTYTVYHYNYQRGTSEAVEDHMHQIEAVLNHVDGRDRTPPAQWHTLLFWGRFVGSDASHKIVQPGCGWAHYPPNASQDYDWANPRYVETDMDDWQPDGNGRTSRMNSERWGGDSLRWFVYWMQHLPGPANGLTFHGKPLCNWWVFIGDYDMARDQRLGLVENEGR